ncbi:MAG: DUF4105 domain-containing protein [Gemmatimonadota bacterium]|nr:DUF4105 domain-containing protein [Gemmatimonadota bacterium]
MHAPGRFRTLGGAVSLLLAAGPGAGLATGPVRVQQAAPLALSDSAVVSLVTVLPGRRLYSLFGHTVIRVRDPATGLDVGFNYGTFDFPETPLGGAGFVARFAYGRLDYALSVQGDPIGSVRRYWRDESRPSVEQVLALTPEQARGLFRALAANARPENRTYRYDFFFDNCATRPRDVIEAALGGRLRSRLADPGTSFRRLLDPYLVGVPLLDLGMDLGLGPPADRIASARQALFLPEWLMEWASAAVVETPGGVRPLVARTDTLTWGPEAAERNPAPPWPTHLAWILCGPVLLLSLADARAGRRGRRGLDGLLLTGLGALGLLLAFLAFVSLHAVTRGNLNLLWAAPTHLVAGVVLLAGGRPRWLRPYMAAAFAAAVVFLVGWPAWPQEIPAAVLPVVLALLARAWLLALPAAEDQGEGKAVSQAGEASSS